MSALEGTESARERFVAAMASEGGAASGSLVVRGSYTSLPEPDRGTVYQLGPSATPRAGTFLGANSSKQFPHSTRSP